MTKKKYVLIIVGVLVVIGLVTVLLLSTSKKKSQDEEYEPSNSPMMSQETFDAIEEEDRLNAPNVYIGNKMPVEKESFSMDDYVDKNRKSIVFVVKLKTISLQQVQEDVNNWLLSEGLTQEQIDTLIIEYDTSFN